MKKVIKIKFFNGFLMFALTAAIFGCRYEQFKVTEVPYVDKTTVELFVGEGAGSRNTIQLKSSPEGVQYVWSSFDKNVATVSQNGVVTAVSEGFTNITVASANDVTNVNVWVRNWIPLEDFSLDKNVVYGYWQDRIRINAALEPLNTTDPEIHWSSSNPDVANVFDNGWLTCYNTGSSVITARSASGIIKTVEVKVYDRPELTPDVFIPRTNWEFPGYNQNTYTPTIGFSSQAPETFPNGRVIAMIDGNINSFYHSRWGEPAGVPVTDYPHWFIVDMKQNIELIGIMLQRRQGNASTATGFRVYTATAMPEEPTTNPFSKEPSADWNWNNCGNYSFDRNSNNAQRITLNLPFPVARYVMMYFGTENRYGTGANDRYIMFAEFGVYGTVVD